MERQSYRDKVFSKYMSTGFGSEERIKKIEEEYVIQGRYFKKNYYPYMPKKSNAQILEVGCGMGHFIDFCREMGYRNTIGVDLSEENIDFCLDRGLNVIKISGEEFLEQNYNTFDCIVFNDVIEHMYKEEILNILCLMKNALKEKGVLLIKTPNMTNPFLGSSGRYICFTHEIGFTEFSLKQIILAANFNKVKVVGTDIYVFSSFINYAAKICSIVLDKLLYIILYMYGRNSLKIFTKDMLAIAQKE